MNNRDSLYKEIVKAGRLQLSGVSYDGCHYRYHDSFPDTIDTPIDNRHIVTMIHSEDKCGILFGRREIEVYADFTDEDAMTEHIYANYSMGEGDPDDQIGHDSEYGIMLCAKMDVFKGAYYSYTGVYVFF